MPSVADRSWQRIETAPKVRPRDRAAKFRSIYRRARQVAALLLIAVVLLAVVLDVIEDGYAVSPPVLVLLLLTAAGLLSVDLPRVRP